MSTILWSTAAAAAGITLGWYLHANRYELVQRCVILIASITWWIDRQRRQEPPSGAPAIVPAPRPVPPTSGASRPRWGADTCVVAGCSRPFSRTTEKFGPEFGYCAEHAAAVEAPTWPTNGALKGGA